ncbi:hypothetical protein K505DRAFT_375553 [Melanomma pulvis-pyrius CBS 109.77]|uniref:Mid2 domain-containing protein n=1 Tax=Melanomma pulvis-pyrius CBS 109.77 TaxID=1314802 RepID=A0A6A6X9N6_9PLEO|nr:hypothetical protein K505DRAFT_375553 [Melanomma pulvis-pyrius CBS 109.77]
MDPSNGNPFLSSILASRSATAASASSVQQAPSSFISTDVGTSSQVESAVESIASISGGQTVFITVTQDASHPSQTSSTTSSTGDVTRKSSTHVGAISGGVLGGVVAIVLSLLLFFLLRRKRKAKENRRATLPPPYADADMSEEIGGAVTAVSTAVPALESKDVTAVDEKASSDPVQQLDSTMIMPTTEMGGDPLGNIPELPAPEPNADPFVTPDSSVQSKTSSDQLCTGEERAGDPDNHVMSWAQYTSMGTRNPSSRLSQPHGAPDVSGAVWSNLSLTKKEDESADT